MFVPVYKWTWSFDNNVSETRIYPYVSNGMKKVVERESGCIFFREKLNGSIRFFNADFDTLDALPIDTKICVNLYISYDKAQTWQIYHRAYFYKTDATWNYDDKIVETSLQANDEYDNILANYDKEYNLIELAPNIDAIDYHKRSCLQIYYTNSEFSGNMIDTTYWESPCEAMEAADVVNDGFSYITSCAKMTITGWDSQHNGEYYSWYNKEVESDVPMPVLIYKGVFQKTIPMFTFGLGYDNGYFVTYQQNIIGRTTAYGMSSIEIPLSSTSVTIPSGAKAKFEMCFVVGRVLTDIDTGVPVGDNDTIGTGNYKYIYHLNNVSPDIVLSLSTSITATEYGKRSDGRYWKQPNINTLPISRTSWDWVSVWCSFWNIDQRLIQNKRYTLKDAYTLDSCINVLLQKADTSLTFSPKADYSQFLYGDTTIRTDAFDIYLTAKTNILKGDYDKPAQKAVVTLKQLLEMLANTFRLFWFVENGKLRIEHEYFFNNGFSYSAIPVIGADLTTQKNIRNGKAIGFAQNTAKYDKINMPERYEFSWMDEASEAFKGLPIEMRSNFVQKGNITTTNVANFSADIDYAMVNSENLSNHGFFVLCTVDGVVPIIERSVKNIAHKLQNGYVAFCDLQPNYWLYDMPCRKLIVNGMNAEAIQVSRNKVQTVKIPTFKDFDTKRLVKTLLGNGFVQKLEITLESRESDVTISFETE